MKKRNGYYTGRQFKNLFEPTTLEEVKGKLGLAWRRSAQNLIKLVEWLEDLNPTDEDEEIYREFRLSSYNSELCAAYGRFSISSLKKLALKIGLIKITNEKYSIGYYGRGYIYSPAVGAILEDLLTLSRITPKRKRYSKYNPVESWVARGKRLFGERWMFSGETYPIPALPSFEELKGLLGIWVKVQARGLLKLFQILLQYTGGGVVENGEALEFFYSGKKTRAIVLKAKKLGLLINTTPFIGGTRPSGYIFNPQIIPLLEAVINEVPPPRVKPPKAPRMPRTPRKRYPDPLGSDEAREAPFTGLFYPDLNPDPDVERIKALIGYDETSLSWYMKAGLLITIAKRLEELNAVENGKFYEFTLNAEELGLKQKSCLNECTFSLVRTLLKKSGIVKQIRCNPTEKGKPRKLYIYNPKILPILLELL